MIKEVQADKTLILEDSYEKWFNVVLKHDTSTIIYIADGSCMTPYSLAKFNILLFFCFVVAMLS